MKPSIQKLQKFFKLEAERGYDNHAVMGGLERMLDLWEAEAHADSLPADLIQVVTDRLRDYARLTEKSRAETLQGLWKRIQRSESGLPLETPFEQEKLEVAPVTSIETATPAIEAPGAAESVPAGAPASKVTARRGKAPPASSFEAPAAMNAPTTVLQGVGPRNAQTLARLGLHTLRDMLYFFPRRYDDYSRLQPIRHLVYGDSVTVIGTVQSTTTRALRGGKLSVAEAVVTDGTGALRVTWFNQPWVVRRLHTGAQISLAGKVEQYLGRPVMNNPEWEPIDQQALNTNRITPVYPLTAQITQRWLRDKIHQVIEYWAPRVQDPLPEDLRQSANLVDLPTALMQNHFPNSWEDLKAAQERLAFDEIFLLQLGVLRQKRAWQERVARPFPVDPDWLAGQISRLPFSLTGAQQRALQDIQQDLLGGHPMNRLIQGDVGSGKTVVAALAIACVAQHGAQAALMAPTSILAEQHYKNILNMLAGENDQTAAEQSDQAAASPALQSAQIRLMIGATPEAEKNEIRTGLADGSIKLVIGTHALIEDPVTFNDLQLVIVDEQHRFGVEQRALLRSKGSNPHLLVMTATPIPRSLALTIYGDLDLTVLDEMPPGRLPISTHVLMPRERERSYALIRSQVEQGRQAFIVYPLVEESDTNDAKAAVEEQERLQKEIFPSLKVGLLHGRMKPDEKDAVMADFRLGRYHILVSTTVIEVGVDIPNATVMLIEGANRFGLAQLHQLRGRVGRAAEKSYCLLIPDTPDDIENERLQVMAETNDGFVLAERDLEQRGPGQFLGTRQAGYAQLQMANLTDVRLIEKARRYAHAVFNEDPNLNEPKHEFLASALQRSWGGEKGDIS
jgi:ATP-dependent DNA helicase RecG